MKFWMNSLIDVFLLPLHIPHSIIFLCSSKRNIILLDLKRYHSDKESGYFTFLRSITLKPDFRAVFYYRIGFWRYLISWLHPVFLNLYILTPKIGPGLRIQHGFSTIIAAKSIGKNFWINQQVTIGYTNDYDCPVIGDNVTINAGAIVIGDIKIGNNSIIGAGAVVTKNVPPNCTVVGNPARIIKKDGERVNIKL
jgi:serine O-acetyltransferase